MDWKAKTLLAALVCTSTNCESGAQMKDTEWFAALPDSFEVIAPSGEAVHGFDKDLTYIVLIDKAYAKSHPALLGIKVSEMYDSRVLEVTSVENISPAMESELNMEQVEGPTIHEPTGFKVYDENLDDGGRRYYFDSEGRRSIYCFSLNNLNEADIKCSRRIYIGSVSILYRFEGLSLNEVSDIDREVLQIFE